MMRISMMKAAIVPLLLLPFLSSAQDSDLGNWLIYIGSKKLDSKWNIHHEVQYRNYNAIGDLEQLLLRTGVGYNLTEGNNNVLLGYGFIQSENYDEQNEDKTGVSEHRIFQQFITKQKIGKVGLQHRYRYEQRWVEGDFRTRFRYFLSLNVPIATHEDGIKNTYLSAYNEIFLNGEGEAFDRNRLYFGFGRKVNSQMRFEVGYMNQFLRNTNRDQANFFMFYNF